MLALTSGLLFIVGVIPASAAVSSGGGVPPGPDIAEVGRVGHQHGSVDGHLPGGSENVDLLGRLKLTNFDGDISDVSALATASDGTWYAYVGDWGAKCNTGGVHIVDVSDPANPVKVGFLNAGGTAYQTEGIHALHIDTSEYTGDILVVSNEWCLPKSNPKLNPGGITIYNIDDPTNPVTLVNDFGDFDLHGNRANEAHSAIAWDAGANAYVAAIDNEEFEDVDIFDITDPTNPELIAETNLPDVNVNAFGSFKTSHDYDVLKFPDGTWHLMVSDWDAGWIDVDVTDPENPTIVGDFDYAACDQVLQAAFATCLQPEGNAHQGEWNSDGSLFLGTDEDFSPFRLPVEFTSGPLAGQSYPGGEFSFTKQVATFPGGMVNGPMVFGGYACPGEDPVPNASVLTVDPGEEKILVVQRGPLSDPHHGFSACFFSDKIAAGEAAGYDVVIVADHHDGSGAGEFPDAFLCGSQGSPVAGTAAGLCVGHRFMHEAFGTTPDYTVPYPDPNVLEPEIGDLGVGEIEVLSQFDGWGYVRVIDTSTPGTPTEIGQITIDETADPDFASGFGDLTIHETEVPRGDPSEGGANADTDLVAYFSWYAGGFRVFDISDPSSPTWLDQLGFYIDPLGNNFWGVALAEDENGDRIVLASDRDYGLFVFQYTGDLPAAP